ARPTEVSLHTVSPSRCSCRSVTYSWAIQGPHKARLPYLDTLDSVSRWCSTQRRSRVPGLSQRNGRCALPQKIYGAVAYTPTNTVRARGGHGRHGVASGLAGSAPFAHALVPPGTSPPNRTEAAISPRARPRGVTLARPSCPPP